MNQKIDGKKINQINNLTYKQDLTNKMTVRERVLAQIKRLNKNFNSCLIKFNIQTTTNKSSPTKSPVKFQPSTENEKWRQTTLKSLITDLKKRKSTNELNKHSNFRNKKLVEVYS